MVNRCRWAQAEPQHVYHDTEWGVPVHDDQKLFEFIVLEGAVAGLSWNTILRRRENYRSAFADFDPQTVATFDAAKQAELMLDEGIIRNRAKIASTVKNAHAFLSLQAEHGSFDAYLWSFVDGTPVQTQYDGAESLPVQTPTAIALSKALKKQGFSFVGPVTMYAYMQAVGMVNDHETGCFRYADLV